MISTVAIAHAEQDNYIIMRGLGSNESSKADKWIEFLCLQQNDRISFFHVSFFYDKQIKMPLVIDADPEIEILENETWRKLPRYKKELFAICPNGLFMPFCTGTPGIGISSFFINKEIISKRLYDYIKNDPKLLKTKYFAIRIMENEYELSPKSDEFKVHAKIASREIVIAIKKINHKTETVDFD